MIVPVVPFNPVVMMLKNEATGRWHPILFWECPFPSGNLGDCWRWKSKGHHTLGFDTRDAALNSPDGGAFALLKSQHETKQGGEVYYDIDSEIPWNGHDVPAMVMTFDLAALTKYD